MLGKLKKTDNKGFTIIEVMIVLAIAGLILLIVLLAVPALQRSGRNSQRRADIGNLASGIGNYVTNNNGTLPTGAAFDTTTNQVTISGTGTSVKDVKFGYYTVAPTFVAFASAPAFGFGPYQHNDPLSNLISTPIASAAAAAAATVNPDNVYVVTGATCSGNTVASGTTRSYAILYELEQSGSSATSGGVAQCQGS